MVAESKAFFYVFSRAVACRAELGNLVCADAQRLFAQHVLACVQRAQRPFKMQLVGQGDVDRVDIGVGQQRVIAGINPWYAEVLRDFATLVRVTRRQRQ